MAETITFALAMTGFLLLATSAWCAARRIPSTLLLASTTCVVVAHVSMVWAVRYEWALTQATRNGYVGFAIFHAALGSLVVANFVQPARSRWFVLFTFAAVCVGANGAIWRYDVVEIYRIPVIACTAIGAFGVVRGLRRPTTTRGTEARS